MRSVISSLVISIAFAAGMGCSSSSSDGASPGGGNKCCPIDPGPNCCMNFGGWGGEDGARCGRACDGMPLPSDPAWKIVKDDHGCDVWRSVGSTGPVCGGDSAPPDTGHDTGDAGGHCCKADPTPGCCMAYGGWTSGDELACAKTCDGMPNPGDPAWKIVKDEHGCDVWSSAGSAGPRCGAPTDAGKDTSSDTSETSTDATDGG